MTLFSGLLVLLLAPEFFQPLRLISQYYHDRAAALGAAAHLMARQEAGTTVPSPVESAPQPPATQDHQGIQVNGLRVSYPDRPPVLENVTVELNPGETLVVTGASGSGKTTLLGVLAGFIRPASGWVHVLGRAPRAIPWVGWGRDPGWLPEAGVRTCGSRHPAPVIRKCRKPCAGWEWERCWPSRRRGWTQ